MSVFMEWAIFCLLALAWLILGACVVALDVYCPPVTQAMLMAVALTLCWLTLGGALLRSVWA